MAGDDTYCTYKVVPAGTNLLTATSEQLDEYGIPEKPDPVAEPKLYAFWERLVAPPFSTQKPEFTTDYLPPPVEDPPATDRMVTMSSRMARPGTQSSQLLASRGGTLESSLNWSGGIIAPPSPKRIVLAVGGWTAPTVTNASQPALHTHSNDHKSLIWVGLDGHNGRLPKISLPQIGTAHWPGVSQFAWWDWWRHGKDTHIQKIKDFAINPGDEIMAGVAVQVTEDVLFFIKNQTTGAFRSFLAKRQALGDILPLGSSAEWVVERPTHPNPAPVFALDPDAVPPPHKLYPLPNYGQVDFKYCMALAAERPLAPARLVTLANNGRMIKMREAFADPYRTVYVSRAKRRHDVDGSIGVTCTFREP